MTLDPNKDVYDIGLSNWQGKDDKRRPMIKKAFNAFINDEKGTYHLSGLAIKILGCNTQVLKDKIIQTRPVMSDVFATDIGLQAQYIDSCVAEDVMLSLLAYVITCLPILEKQMYESFNKVVGTEIAVTCEVIKSHRTLDIKNKDMGSRALDADILDIDQLKKEYEYQLEDTLMQRYFKSYQVSTDGHKGYSL